MMLRENAPAGGARREAPFPAVARSRLANGMGIDVVTARALPIVQVRVIVRIGAGYAGNPAAALLTADMLKDGGTRALSSAELVRRIETLGADLSVTTDADATVLATAVPKEQLAEVMGLVAQVVREPRFDGEELRKRKARAIDEAEDAARSSGAVAALRVVFRELYPEKTPYASFGLIPAEIARVDGAVVRDVHRRFYVPRATTLVLAGDIEPAAARELGERHFGSWSGGEPARVDLAPPRPPPSPRLFVAHRPKSAQSDVYVALVGPSRSSPEWPSARVATQILGGGVASRLFADVREQRSLAYRTNAQVLERARGEQPVVLYAGTQTEKTAQAVTALLENVAAMSASPLRDAEVETARRYLADVLAIRMETIGSIADMVVTQEVFGLPDGYWDAYRKAVRGTERAEAELAAKKIYVSEHALVVVAGDADVVGPELARFGEVTVVDPEKEWKTVRTIREANR